MPETVHCPECDRKLRVPDDRLGKRVKCPGCSTIFTAAIGPEEDEAIQEKPRRQPPARPARAIEEEEDDPEEEEEKPRRKRRRRSSGAVLAQVTPAATAMLVSGIIMCILGLINIPMSLTFEASGSGSVNNVSLKDLAEKIQGMGKVWGVISGILAMVSGAISILGALKMKNLQSYGLALTASILTALPLTTCCCWGLPIGIWALVVLLRPDVKDAFR